jgi:Putative Flp pilus-assembly TadE/G-like
MKLAFLARGRSANNHEPGQILVIFALAFAIVIMMLALLFDGARAVVLKRQLQDGSDAAAMAAANTFQGLSVKGCSATTSPVGSPQAAVVAAAKASVATNLPDYPQGNVVVTCTADNAAQVTLGKGSPSFFGSIFGGSQLTASSTSVAQNGFSLTGAFSIVLLDPSAIDSSGVNHYAWPNGRQGCPSFGINGGITATFDSAIFIDSACDVSHGGAFAPNGGSATVTFGSGQAMHITGEYNPGSLTVTPAPLIHQPPKADPLLGLPPPPVSSMTIRSASKLVINGTQSAAQCSAKGLLGGNPGCTLLPGVYVGGIQLKSSAEIYLRPGIYVLKDGGLDLGSQSKVFSVNPTALSATTTSWDLTDCPAGNCGVLLYKTTVTSSDQIAVTAGATFMVRSFNPDVDGTSYGGSGFDPSPLRHMLIWQDASPNASATYAQPTLQLQGGGNVVMQGAVYAPQAAVDLHGNAGGSGGSSVDLTIQFIVWDMSLSGNSSFHFIYSASEFPKALDYGLIQ